MSEFSCIGLAEMLETGFSGLHSSDCQIKLEAVRNTVQLPPCYIQNQSTKYTLLRLILTKKALI
jgi:hypothetical protein